MLTEQALQNRTVGMVNLSMSFILGHFGRIEVQIALFNFQIFTITLNLIGTSFKKLSFRWKGSF